MIRFTFAVSDPEGSRVIKKDTQEHGGELK